jgi:hypothetical protein
MRKITAITAFALAIFLLSQTGCKKDFTLSEELKEESSLASSYQDSDVQVVDGRLSFKDVDSYERTVKYLASIGDDEFPNWESRINFNSMRRDFLENNKEKVADDDLLATLLNPDGFIQIEKFVFKIDLKKEQA